MHKMNDEFLVESYCLAIKLNLENDFVALLKEEIDRRKLSLNMKN